MSDRNRLSLITAPAIEPVTLRETKQHLRILNDNEDEYIAKILIPSAREMVENLTGRALVARTYDYKLDHFPPLDTTLLKLPMPPLISVTSVKYQDSSNVQQTWASAEYDVITDATFSGVRPKYGENYPSTLHHPDSVVVRYVAGYADSGASPADFADMVPMNLKHAMWLLIGHGLENREATITTASIATVPLAFHDLIAPYRVYWS